MEIRLEDKDATVEESSVPFLVDELAFRSVAV